ncbi:hypothetical protein M0812_21027 [Anaeramoeba flamelloides]|uniref:PAS domain-containing protein n=1 Tax=Anaeramoeba flamelloides TaxID=1746091 RepID=A0AAV7YTN8_9EUKA|nr:hypothetical protein M0812_21027 [Anaeramoeba flamelloides]
MGMKYSSYKRKEVIRIKNIKDFYNLLENSNHGLILLNEQGQVLRYNPFMYKLCSISEDEAKANIGNSPVNNNKPGGKGILNLYQPQYNESAPKLIEAVNQEVEKNNTTETFYLLKNKKNPEHIFFAKTYLRKIQIGKENFILCSFFVVKDVPFNDPYYYKNKENNKKIKPKNASEKNINYNNNNRNQNEKQNQKEKKRTTDLGHFRGHISIVNNFNINSTKNSESTIVELGSGFVQNDFKFKTNENSKKSKSYKDEENPYNSCVECVTDLQNEPKEDFVKKNQNPKQTQMFLTSALIMNNIIAFNINNPNLPFNKNSKFIPNEINSGTSDFTRDLYKNINYRHNKTKHKTKQKQRFKTNKKKHHNKNKHHSKKKHHNKNKHHIKNKHHNKNKYNNNNKDNNNSKSTVNNFNINFNINSNNTKINNNSNNNNSKINNNNNNNDTHSFTNNTNNDNGNDNNNNSNNEYNSSNDNNNSKTKNNNSFTNNTINDNDNDNNNNNNNSTTAKNTIYKFIIEDDEKLEFDLESILPSSNEIDKIFQDYELENELSDQQLDLNLKK